MNLLRFLLYICPYVYAYPYRYYYAPYEVERCHEPYGLQGNLADQTIFNEDCCLCSQKHAAKHVVR
jgi:hypothetical protein